MPTPRSKPEISADIIARVTAEAERLGEDPRAIVHEVRLGTPTGRFILKMLGIRSQTVKAGRPYEDDRLKIIYKVVDDLMWEGMSRAEAFKAAPKILASLGVFGTGRPPRPLTAKSIREAFRRYWRIWFDEPVAEAAKVREAVKPANDNSPRF